MLSLINGYRRDERGATATEYPMLIVFIALAVAVGANVLGTGINGLFTKVSETLTAVTVSPLPNS